MEAKREFRGSDTHGVLQRCGADIHASSEGYGWSSIYASIQRENPFEGRFEAIADDLIVLHRSGPVQTTFASGGHVTSRCIPRGSVFFLPAGQRQATREGTQLGVVQMELRHKKWRKKIQRKTVEEYEAKRGSHQDDNEIFITKDAILVHDPSLLFPVMVVCGRVLRALRWRGF